MSRRKKASRKAPKPEQQLRFTAIHEAGHAVAHQRLGFTSLGCSIEANEGSLGRAYGLDGDLTFATQAADGVFEIPEAATRNVITVLYAGYCAEVTAGQEERLARGGAGLDFEAAEEKRENLAERNGEAECLTAAFAFVREDWKAVELVAAQLLEHEQLSGDEVDLLLDVADGKCSLADLERFRASVLSRDAVVITADDETEIARRMLVHQVEGRVVLWHRTTEERREAILRDGFRDNRGFIVAGIAQEFEGVFVSNTPVDVGEGAKGHALLRVLLDVTLEQLAEYEIVEDEQTYREYLVPAALLNTKGNVEAVEDFDG